jgi:hypothetical protein
MRQHIMARLDLDGIAARLAIVLVASCTMAVAQNNQNKRISAIPPSTPPAATSPGTQPANGNRGMLGASQSGGMLAKPSLPGNNDVEQMTQAQFRGLPDTAMLRYKGQSLTKANFMQQRLKEFRMQANGIQPKAGLTFEMLKTQFQQKQAADLASKNARAEAVMDALNNRTKQIESSASYSALAKEARDLQRRYSSSNSTQKAPLKQRALEIHNQLLEMEQGNR